ncbi:hypothetical protein, partial [Brachyspira hyodysenteriae]|uniref:hypothetical protein n=1 Tax=Brachyspira hyodysenteriae TaxID=159 RepID=UPI0019553FE7
MKSIDNIYLNNYICQKLFYYFYYLWGLAPHTPTSFATEGSACGIATGEARLRREAGTARLR